MLGSSKPGIAGRLKKAQALSSCKASVPSGAQVPRGREARVREGEERSSPVCGRAWRWNAPPVFAGTHHPSRGDAGTLDLGGSSACARRTSGCPVRAERTRGSASRSSVRTTKRCAKSVREGDSPAEKRDEPFLGSARSRGGAPSGARLRGSSARAVPRSREKAAPRRRRSEASHLRAQHEESMRLVVVPVRRRIAEVGRTPSGSEKRAIGTQWVESPDGIRSA
jgi:hypothetical protein